MKNIKMFTILFLALILTACGTADTTKEYVSTQKKLLLASQTVDDNLVAELNKAKKNKKTFSELEAMIKSGRDLQQSIYNGLSASEVSKNGKAASEGSLLYVSEKITAYSEMIKTLSMENYELLAQSVQSHQTLAEQYELKAIEDINISLTAAGEPTIESFHLTESKK